MLAPRLDQLLSQGANLSYGGCKWRPRCKEAIVKVWPKNLFDPFMTHMTCLRGLRVVLPNLGVWALCCLMCKPNYEQIRVERRWREGEEGVKMKIDWLDSILDCQSIVLSWSSRHLQSFSLRTWSSFWLICWFTWLMFGVLFSHYVYNCNCNLIIIIVD